MDWEAPEVQEKIRATIDFLTKGCNCKKAVKQKDAAAAKTHTADEHVNAMDASTHLSKYMKMTIAALMKKHQVRWNPQVQMSLQMKA